MKRFAAAMLLLVVSHAHADCQDRWLELNSSRSYLTVTYSEGCYRGELILNFSKRSKRGPNWPSPDTALGAVPFDRECPWEKRDINGETIQFSCRKDGVSPLAGATYRFRLTTTVIRCDGVAMNDWEHTFICVSGCGPTTPKRLEQPYGEGCA